MKLIPKRDLDENSAGLLGRLLPISGSDILPASIITRVLKDGSIATAKIKDLAVTTAKIDSLAVTTAKIGLLAVDTAQIAALAVTDAKINTLAVSKLTTGTMTADVTISNTFKTAASPNPRIEITSSLIAGYSDATTKQFYVQASDGKAYFGGGNVVLSSTGINIFGLANALTTRATATGTIQCYIGTDGKLYAGAGAVVLDSTGLRLYGDSAGFYLGTTYQGGIFTATDYFVFSAANNAGFSIEGANDSWIGTTAGDIVVDPAGNDIYPNTAAQVDLGTATNYFDQIEYKGLNDEGCPAELTKNPLIKLRGISTKKRMVTLVDADKEAMGKRATKMLKNRGATETTPVEIDEWDKATFPDEVLSYPTQEDIEKGRVIYQKALQRYAVTKRGRPPKHIEPHPAVITNELVWLILRSLQELAEKVDTLEQK